jgi:acetylornithine deacetylase
VKGFEAFVALAAADDALVQRCPEPNVEWVGVVHAGYTLAPGSEAEAVLAEAYAAAHAPDRTPLQAYVMACYLDAAVYSVHGGYHRWSTGSLRRTSMPSTSGYLFPPYEA